MPRYKKKFKNRYAMPLFAVAVGAGVIVHNLSKEYEDVGLLIMAGGGVLAVLIAGVEYAYRKSEAGSSKKKRSKGGGGGKDHEDDGLFDGDDVDGDDGGDG